MQPPPSHQPPALQQQVPQPPPPHKPRALQQLAPQPPPPPHQPHAPQQQQPQPPPNRPLAPQQQAPQPPPPHQSEALNLFLTRELPVLTRQMQQTMERLDELIRQQMENQMYANQMLR